MTSCYTVAVCCDILLCGGSMLWHLAIRWQYAVTSCYMVAVCCDILLCGGSMLWHLAIRWQYAAHNLHCLLARQHRKVALLAVNTSVVLRRQFCFESRSRSSLRNSLRGFGERNVGRGIGWEYCEINHKCAHVSPCSD